MNKENDAKQNSQADPRAPGCPWLLPYLTVKDADASIAFYEKSLGFTLESAMRDNDGRVMHAEMRYQDQMIMFVPEGAFGGTMQAPASKGETSSVTFYIYVADVDAAYKTAMQHGAVSTQEPVDAFWGDRYATVNDPDGYAWSLAKNFGEFDPSKVPSAS